MPHPEMIRFYKPAQKLNFQVSNDTENNDQVILLAALPSMRASSDHTAREFPKRLRDGADAMEIGIQLIDSIARKLHARGYAVVMNGDNPQLGEGQKFQTNVYAIVKTGPGKMVHGLGAAIEEAYYEVLRENKALAAYMSKGQGAKRGA